MTVTNPAGAELFRITIFKAHENDISDRYVNTYEVQALPDGLDFSNVSALVQDIVDFERQLARSTIVFDRAVVSTWEEEPGGYDPASFVTIPLDVTGELSGTANALPLEAALFVRRAVQSGRQGKLFLRGYLEEADVENRSGAWSLSNQAAILAEVQAAVDDHIVQYGLGPASPIEFQFVLAARNVADALFIRPVVNFVPAGVTWAKRSRRHYNRCEVQ